MANAKSYQEVLNNFQRVNERIVQAAYSVGRDPDQVRLIVVTKGHQLDNVKLAIDVGAKNLGENYLEEAVPKIQELSDCPEVEWHMIGHVQSRKARSVSEHFRWVHSVDSLKLATRLDRFAEIQGRMLSVLLEVNVSGEGSKFGFQAWNPSTWDKLVDELQPILILSNLRVRGLMTMAPFLQDPEDARPFFQRLRRLQEFLSGIFTNTTWDELSMGMSADFYIAIQEGATMVRIGQAILGPRQT